MENFDADLNSKILTPEGFDTHLGKTWIYPTNYEIRDYQFNIIKEALFKNTLVSLPTGLGKTFIAAVIMYNFYRWYPQSKIIFMAPTRPLVKQQIDACYNIMGIPEQVTIELNGSITCDARLNIWLEKRVIFATPHVLQNDLDRLVELGGKIKCLVFDEAHRAKGNYAYCQVIKKLINNGHKSFRVLALSATPGSTVGDVTEVAQNLLISHLEFRTEQSKDVKPFAFERVLETIVVKLDLKLIEIKDEYLKVVEFYAKTLRTHNIIQGNYASLTRGKIFMILNDFKSKNHTSSANYSEIIRTLSICVTLYHALELLIRHGLRNFLSFFDEHIEKPLLRNNNRLRQLLEIVRNYLGPIPNIELLPNGTYPEIPKTIKFGHPKHYKLRDLLLEHFANEDTKNSRVIVFFEYRDSVMESHTLLLQSRPLIKPKIFHGKGPGVTEKTQLNAVKSFKEGKCNTLLSTCIGEEGLDVGEVDLIICFDISTKSPIRMVQRMGRTGRKRAGKVYILVTEGKEQQTLQSCLIHKDNITAHVLGSTFLKNNLYKDSPRLVPDEIQPKCEKMFITIKERSIKDLLGKIPSKKSNDINFSQDNEENVHVGKEKIPPTQLISLQSNFSIRNKKSFNKFSYHIEKMRKPQKTFLISHSEATNMFTELLNYADSKRFNIPIKSQVTGNNWLKQGDIRSMFLKSNTQNTQETSQKVDDPVSDGLYKSISNFLISNSNNALKCPYCPKNFDCKSICLKRNDSASIIEDKEIFVPSEDILNDISLKDIEEKIISLQPDFYRKIVPKKNNKPNDYSFQAPKGYLEVLNKTNIIAEQENDEDLLKIFNLSSFNELMGNCAEETVVDDYKEETDDFNIEDLCDLSYFGLDNEKITELKSDETTVPESPLIPSSLETPKINEEEISLSIVFSSPEISSSNKENENIIEENSAKVDVVLTQEISSSNKENENMEDFKEYHRASASISSVSNKRAKKTNMVKQFFDFEAELASDEDIFVSEDEEEGLNCYEKSFVNDETQILNTQARVMYIDSINKSPEIRSIKPMRNLNQIYSQPPPLEESEYLEDSFCVDIDDEAVSQNTQLSPLEILEKKLKSKRKRKTKIISNNKEKKIRLNRIIEISSDSDS